MLAMPVLLRRTKAEEVYVAYMFTTEPDGSAALFTETCVEYMAVGAWVSTQSGTAVHYPLVVLLYSKETLKLVAPLLDEMVRKEEEPTVYIWDEDKADPEIAVFFSTQDPNAMLLKALNQNEDAMIFTTLMQIGCTRVSTSAEANLTQEESEDLVTNYAACGGRFMIVVKETGMPESAPALYTLTTRTLLRQDPLESKRIFN